MREIPLTRNMVDDEDFEEMSKYKWTANIQKRQTYAIRVGKEGENRTVYMHRQIMQPPPGTVVDHKDGNGLRNTRDNLRVVNRAQNYANMPKIRGTSKYKGVSRPTKNSKMWVARIKGQNFLGIFLCEEYAPLTCPRGSTKRFQSPLFVEEKIIVGLSTMPQPSPRNKPARFYRGAKMVTRLLRSHGK